MNELRGVPVYIVDDDDSVRQALRYLLEGYGFKIADFSSGNAFLEQTDILIPGCLILDSRMPGLSGQQVQARLNSDLSPIEVIFLTSHGDVPMAVKAFRDGACDFFQKPVDVVELIPSIERSQMESLASYRQHRYLEQLAALTPRERELFDLVVQGKTNRQIAETLHIAVRTVEVHRAKMMEHLGAESIADLVRISETTTR